VLIWPIGRGLSVDQLKISSRSLLRRACIVWRLWSVFSEQITEEAHPNSLAKHTFL
jgi:hypothetical protein